MQLPTYDTFMASDDRNREIWYKAFIGIVNLLPQTGSGAPEGKVRANQSCQYVQTDPNTNITTLWVNQIGNGSLTGWVSK